MYVTDRKSKLPERAILLLLITMCLADICNSACLGPVCIVRVQNFRLNRGQGYVQVIGKQVLARKAADNQDGKLNLYKISTVDYNDVGFYLYDSNAKRFICWKKTLDRVIGMNIKRINARNLWPYCKFKDYPSTRTSYVRLQASLDNSTEIIFNRNGRQPKVKRNCKKKNRFSMDDNAHRHEHCDEYGDFLVLNEPVYNGYQHAVYRALCKGELRNMRELSVICRKMRINETIN
ncbi:uncharacterized protein LOC132701984 isoform X1 [Cylas formicarius]|uniref:uncharacterized protein LOC132701984 isoform X1 n=1 Tax=Cylas formicarius TaxID=197179 RepID=UPI002958A5D8|nr:uncharacterized protein LOC132701984 isoform X1 [Cylas formicarius]